MTCAAKPDDLRQEAEELLDEISATVREAGLEVERVERMVGSAEAISEVVGSASRLVGGAVASPFIKLVALGSGVARGLRLVRGGGRGRGRAPGPGRRAPAAPLARAKAGRGTPARGQALAVRSSARSEPRPGADKVGGRQSAAALMLDAAAMMSEPVA